jgi:hypothetical protein
VQLPKEFKAAHIAAEQSSTSFFLSGSLAIKRWIAAKTVKRKKSRHL